MLRSRKQRLAEQRELAKAQRCSKGEVGAQRPGLCEQSSGQSRHGTTCDVPKSPLSPAQRYKQQQANGTGDLDFQPYVPWEGKHPPQEGRRVSLQEGKAPDSAAYLPGADAALGIRTPRGRLYSRRPSIEAQWRRDAEAEEAGAVAAEVAALETMLSRHWSQHDMDMLDEEFITEIGISPSSDPVSPASPARKALVLHSPQVSRATLAEWIAKAGGSAAKKAHRHAETIHSSAGCDSITSLRALEVKDLRALGMSGGETRAIHKAIRAHVCPTISDNAAGIVTKAKKWFRWW